MDKFSAISPHPSLVESLHFLISGFAIVLLTLLILAIVTALAGRLFSLLPSKVPPAVKPAPLLAESEPELEDTKVLAALTAAVHTVFKAPVRITKVVTAQGDPSWSREGRRQIQESHNLRK